jgi:PAS domain S-box-containing protein
METGRSRLLWTITNLKTPFPTGVLVCLVAVLSYLAAILGGTLVPVPQTVSPLWPGCALLVSVLLLVPRRIWPILIAAAFASFVLYDLQHGVTIRSAALLILADTVEVLTAALCLSYFFDGVPRLNNVKALAKYSSFAVILAPSNGAFVGALATSGNYWTSWRIGFFSEAIAFLTLTPAILGWVSEGPAWAQKSRACYLEFAALIAALTLVGYLAFVAPGRGGSPALLYSVVPFLLWSALRFGSTGASTSVIVVAFMSIWGAVHGRGPFTETEPINEVLSLQLFLFFTAAPFMVLAALVEERKRAEQSLRESEERFRLVANTAPALIWMSGVDKLCTFFNQGWLDFTGRSMEEELGEGWASGVHPDDLERCLGIYTAAFDTRLNFEMEYRLRRFDGNYRWIVDYGVPRFESDGTFCGYIGSCIDITDRKLAEEALRDMSGRLIAAHEEERMHIARELHDDLSQRTALLSVSLAKFEQGTPHLSSKARQELQNVAKVVREVSSDIHNLSHQLHPSMLELAGLVAAVKGFCEEFSKQHDLQIKFVHNDVPGQISKDLTLCLFRIVQEALRNVVKHSGAAEAKVELSGHGDRIDLCISDSGAGFNPHPTKGDTGLGLISMRERLRLVGGHLAVESEPSHGTRIRVRVPLRSTSAKVTVEGKAHQAGA